MEFKNFAETSDSRRHVALHITGTVQGVFFRREAQREGIKLGLSGFVKNEPDGSVIAQALGGSAQVGAFINWCRRGPAHARVEEVRITELPLRSPHHETASDEGHLNDEVPTFHIRY